MSEDIHTHQPPIAKHRTGTGKWLAIAAVTGFFLFLLYQFGLFIMVVMLSFRDPGTSAFMRANLTQLKEQNPAAQLHYQWVPYHQISDHLKRAVVASEDANFFSHGGIEWAAIRQAWHYNRQQAEQGASRMRGGSTITQQLAKNLFLSGNRSYVRKAQELLLSYMLEAVLSKQRILELYLNLAQWGQGIFGARAAAQHYYQRSAAQLTEQQAARLAAMLPNPAYYDQHGNTNWLRSRTATIQQRSRLIRLPPPEKS